MFVRCICKYVKFVLINDLNIAKMSHTALGVPLPLCLYDEQQKSFGFPTLRTVFIYITVLSMY